MTTGTRFGCPQCGSRYIVRQLHSAEKRTGVVRCYICDKVLATFNDLNIPVFALTSAAPWPVSTDEIAR
jgi:predicted Zn finger-like uncharacterized protein